MRSPMCATWLLAQPTPGQVRAGDALADPAFHQAMAARLTSGTLDVAVLLGERLARTRGAGGQSVAGSWADGGAEVTVIADTDPRRRSATRQLLVDDVGAVEQWARGIRDLGATGACWHADLGATPSADQARVTAAMVAALTGAGVAPVLWVARRGRPSPTGAGRVRSASVPGPERLHDLLEGARSHGADLARLTVCVPVEPPLDDSGTQAGLGEVVTELRRAIPAEVRRVVVVVPRARLHLAQGDAFELAGAVTRRTSAWPIAHCAGDLALRQVGDWWREPGLARRAGNRFETILGQLARPSGPVFSRRDGAGSGADGAVGTSETAATSEPLTTRQTRGVFDTSLFRRRSLYRTSEVQQP